MGHGQGETDRDRGINRISTRFQDSDTYVNREGFLCDNHTFAGECGFVGLNCGRDEA
jgi:hypothetical protein